MNKNDSLVRNNNKLRANQCWMDYDTFHRMEQSIVNDISFFWGGGGETKHLKKN